MCRFEFIRTQSLNISATGIVKPGVRMNSHLHRCYSKLWGIITRENKSFLLIFLFSCVPVQAAQADELESLMQAMAAVKHRIVRYQEEKQMELLEAPLSSEGTLEYIAPDKLVRSVFKPSRIRYIIDNKMVTIEKGDKSRTRNLDELPVVRVFVESFRATLAGDLTSLQKHYDIEFSGTVGQWEIILRPKDKQLTDYVESLQLAGIGDRILLYMVEDSNGDLTRMRLFSDEAGEAEVGE